MKIITLSDHISALKNCLNLIKELLKVADENADIVLPEELDISKLEEKIGYYQTRRTGIKAMLAKISADIWAEGFLPQETRRYMFASL